MAYTTVYSPQYRDADESGLVGTLGLLAMLQESVLGHAAALGLDHDELVRARGIGWMFARYRLAVARKAVVRRPVTLTTWIYAAPGARFLNNEVLVEQDGSLVAAGRVESCFYDMNARRVTAPAAVGLPSEAYECGRGTAPVGPWRDLPQDPAPLGRVRSHTVGYTDLDSFRHMTNLRYPGLVVDAFSSRIYGELSVRDMERSTFCASALRATIWTSCGPTALTRSACRRFLTLGFLRTWASGPQRLRFPRRLPCSCAVTVRWWPRPLWPWRRPSGPRAGTNPLADR